MVRNDLKIFLSLAMPNLSILPRCHKADILGQKSLTFMIPIYSTTGLYGYYRKRLRFRGV